MARRGHSDEGNGRDAVAHPGRQTVRADEAAYFIARFSIGS